MRRLITLFLFAIIFGSYAMAYDFSAVCESGQTLYYRIVSNTEPYTVAVTSQKTSFPFYSTYPTGDLTIPSSVPYSGGTYSVTSIDNFAFDRCASLTSVTIPNSVTNIGNSAFNNCSGLTSVSISNSVTSIGNNAFSCCCGLTSVTIPNSVTSIGDNAFDRVKNIVYSGTATGSQWGALTINGIFDDDFIFSDAEKTNLTAYIGNGGDITIPNSVTSIGVSAFYYCAGLTSVTIPNSVTSIGNMAFYYCTGLTSVTIPNSVTSIGNNAFAYCSGLTSAYYTGTIAEWCEITFYSYDSNPLYCANNLYVANNLVTDLVIPNDVTEIKPNAFCGASCLTSVLIPNSVTRISDYAFYYCRCLTSVTIGNSVTSIGEYAFSHCFTLTSVTIPSSVTSIGTQAFYACSRLTDIYAKPIIPPTVGRNIFNNFNGSLWIPCGSTDAYQSAETWSNFYNINEYNTIYTLTISSENLQRGNVSIVQAPDCGDGTAIITAIPVEKNVFTQWNDGNTDNPRAITLTCDTTFVASFEYACDSSTFNISMNGESYENGIYYYDVCEGESIDLGGIVLSGTAASWRWHIDSHDGNPTVATTRNAIYTPLSARGYDITLMAKNQYGCSKYAYGRIRVSGGLAVPAQVSPAPNGICQGSERIITIGDEEDSEIQVARELYGVKEFFKNTETTFLPDGNNICYNTSIDINMFEDGATITSIDDIDRIYLNMEHSYLGDLSIMMECPNGQRCMLHHNSKSNPLGWSPNGITVNNSQSIDGSTTHLGLAHDEGSCDNDPGYGLPYFFYPDGTEAFGQGGINVRVNRSDYADSLICPDQVQYSSILAFGSEHRYGTYQSLSSLVGCPLNGEWTLYICDYMTSDNGWIFEWGLSFREDLYPDYLWDYDLYAVSTQSNSFGVSDYSNASGASIMIAPPANFSGDNYINVKVVDNMGCITNSPIEVNFTVTPTFDASITGDTHICDGSETTLAAVTDGGGIAPFTYNWNTTETTRSISITNLVGSTPYNVEVIDASGCTGTAAITVFVGAPIVSMSSTNACYGESYGTATATIVDNYLDGSYTYAWSDGTTITTSQNTHSIAVPIGTYGVTVTDADGCSATDSVAVIIADSALSASLSAEIIQHNGGTTNITSTVEGGTAPYTYEWSNSGTTHNLDSVGAGNYSVIVTDSNGCTATASIIVDEPELFTITVSVVDETMGTVSGSGTFDYGTEIQISATPAEHYHFVQWTDGNMDNPRTINVTNNATYNAEFAIDQHTVIVSSGNSAFGTVSGGGTYDYGTERQISATANEYYHFVQWNDGSTDNPRTILVSEDATYTAIFAIDQFVIIVASANETMGTVSGGGTFVFGAIATLTATSNEGYEFVSWNDGNTEYSRQITVTGDGIYVASFSVASQTVSYTITAVSANPNYGIVTGGGTYAESTEITLTATPNGGYEFVQWSDENTENPRTITVTENAIYIAIFSAVTIPTIYNEFTVAACGSYIWNDSTYTQSGDYEQIFTASSSADSIVTLHLTILPLPEPEISVDGILDACNPETTSVTLSTGEYDSYMWSNGETVESVVVTTPGSYYVEAVDENGCHGFSEEVTIGYSTILTEAPQIKNAGMNDNGFNVIGWRVTQTEGIASFEIYREDNATDVFSLIAVVTRSSARTYIDSTANPSARAYRYKICAVDACGGMSPMSEPHKTMHLTINQGVSSDWNLIWSHYEGLDIRSYKIYRGTTKANMVVIGEVPSSHNLFTDSSNPYNIGFFYKVAIVKNTRSDEEEQMLTSNIVDNGYIVTHNVIVASSNPIYGSASGSGVYAEGTEVFIEAAANDGYEFSAWNDGSTENPRSVTITSDTLFIANFVELQQTPTFTITVYSSNQAYGTVLGGGTYEEGTEITLTATANDGYGFVSWSDGSLDNPRTITVTEDAIYIATFVETASVVTYTITALSANPSQGTVTGGGTYPEGSVISIEAIANDGYQFVSWSDNCTDNPRSITVFSDVMYIAAFVPMTDIFETSTLEISIFPNPVNDILNITSSRTISEIEIVNVIGQVVRRIEVDSDNVVCNVEDLMSGVYVVKIRTASATLSQRKFVKE